MAKGSRAASPGWGRPGPELAQLRPQLPLVGFPQRCRRRLIEAAGQLVVEPGQGPVIEAAVAFQAAPGFEPGRRLDLEHAADQGPHQGQGEERQERRVDQARQLWQEIEQGEDGEGAKNPGRRPEGRPKAFPQER